MFLFYKMLNNKKVNKSSLFLEKFFLYGLIFALPFQTRLLLRSWGIGFNEWNSSFIYFTDLIFLGLIALWFFRNIKKVFSKEFLKNQLLENKFLFSFLMVAGVSTFWAFNRDLAVFRFLKLVQLFVLYLYIKNSLGITWNLKTAMQFFIFSSVFQSLIAISQFFLKHSLGLKILGESPLNLYLPQVASFFADGDKVLRAYGTFPHPNLLAAFLFLALFALYFLYFDVKRKARLFYAFLSIPISTALILTFSRLIIALWVSGLLLRLLILIVKKHFRVKALASYKKPIWTLGGVAAGVVIILLIFLWPVFGARFNLGLYDESIMLRSFYLRVALSIPNQILGVGIGNFTPWFMGNFTNFDPHIYQPVHNIYILLFAETGTLGLLFFVLFLIYLAKDYLEKQTFDQVFHYSLFIVFCSFLLIGFFDHFLLTLQQGYLMFGLVLGLIGALANHQIHQVQEKSRGLK